MPTVESRSMRRQSHLIAAILTAVFIGGVSAAQAEVSVETMLAQGRYAEVLTLVDDALTRGDSPDLHLMRGYALLGLARVAEAQEAANRTKGAQVPYLRHVLNGHIATQNGQFNKAAFAYRRAIDTATSVQRRRTAQSLTKTAMARRHWVWTAGLSFRRGNNLNFATTQDTVMIGGLPFVLPKENLATSGVTADLTLSGKYKVINTRNHLLQIGATTSASWQNGQGFGGATVGLTLDGTWLRDGTTLGYGAAVSAPTRSEGDRATSAYLNLSQPIAARQSWSAHLAASQSGADATAQTNQSIAITLSGQRASGLSYSVSATRGQTQSDNANVSSHLRSLRISAAPQSASLPFKTSFSAQYDLRNFDQPTPFFGELRIDQTLALSATISPKDYTVLGMTPSVTFKATKRQSNIDINDAQSVDIFLGLQSNF